MTCSDDFSATANYAIVPEANRGTCVRGIGQGGMVTAIRAWFSRLMKMRAVQRERAHLGGLPDHMLRDIGITRADAEHEAGRPPWDLAGVEHR